MSIGSVLRQIQTIAFGLLTFVLEVLPTMGDLFARLGLSSWLDKFNAVAAGQGLEADDLIEQNVDTLDGVVFACDRGIDLLVEVKTLALDIKEEGTKVRPDGVADAVSPEVAAALMKRMLALPGFVSSFRMSVAQVHPALLSVAQAEMKRDVSASPTLNC